VVIKVTGNNVSQSTIFTGNTCLAYRMCTTG